MRIRAVVCIYRRLTLGSDSRGYSYLGVQGCTATAYNLQPNLITRAYRTLKSYLKIELLVEVSCSCSGSGSGSGSGSPYL